MKRIALVAILLAGAGFLACSGPTTPPADAGFFPSGMAGTWGTTGGSVGTAGIWGVGGSGGTGGSIGGGNTGGAPQGGGGRPDRRRDGGSSDSGTSNDSGAGGPPMRRRDAGPSPDATPMAECPGGTKDGEPCMMADATCLVSSGDAGQGQLCTCRVRKGEGTWRCEEP